MEPTGINSQPLPAAFPSIGAFTLTSKSASLDKVSATAERASTEVMNRPALLRTQRQSLLSTKFRSASVGGEGAAASRRSTSHPPPVATLFTGLKSSDEGKVCKIAGNGLARSLRASLQLTKSGGGERVGAVGEKNTQGSSPLAEAEKTAGIIKKTWEHGEHKATETVSRASTYDDLRDSCQKEIHYLKEKLENLAPGDERKKIEGRLDKAEKILNACKENKPHNRNSLQKEEQNWASSDFFRDLVRGNIDTQADAGSKIESYEKIMKDTYLPLAVNLRTHSCTVDDVTNSVVRVGVISDMSNGFTDLAELKQIDKELSEGSGQSKTLDALKKNIEMMQKKEMESGNKYIEASAGYALKQLTSPETIKQAIVDRRDNLERQFLQMAMEHLKVNKEKIMEKGSFQLLHIGLLNHKSQSVDAMGWNHDEGKELKDMAEIYKEFQGKNLICDGKGPFIDEHGDIHLPEGFGESQGVDGGVKKIPIQAAVINCSVQGYTKHDGISKEVNTDGKKQIEEMIKGDKEKISGGNAWKFAEMERQLFDAKETGYAQAIELVQLAKEMDLDVSITCLSAKDRTGVVCAGWAVSKQMKNFSKEARNKFMNEQFDAGAPGIEVVRQNTGMNVMKVSTFSIPGLTDHFSGMIKRPGQLAAAGLGILFVEGAQAKRKMKGD